MLQIVGSENKAMLSASLPRDVAVDGINQYIAQVELERTMVQRGITRYEASVQKAQDGGIASRLPYAQKMLKDNLLPVIEALHTFVAEQPVGRRNPVRALLSDCEPAISAFLAMQVLFNSFTYESALASTAVQIGRRIEDEIRFGRFEDMQPDYYRAVQQDFRRKGTQGYRHKHRVMTHKANELEDGWTPWTPSERAAVGMKLLDIILATTKLIEKKATFQHGKTSVFLLPTPEALAKVAEHNEFARFLYPDRMPCVVRPADWAGLDQGGYYTEHLRAVTPMVKTTSKRHRRVIETADLSKVMEALNVVQAVSWQVNAAVLAVMQSAWQQNLALGMPHKDPLKVEDSPFKERDKDSLSEEEKNALSEWKAEAAETYTQERLRLSKAMLTARILNMAEDFSDKTSFWYVWYADFRGRLYTATSGFSPQGPDTAKGLLRFAEGKPLGSDGWFWLRVHGANRFGYDKVSYEDRAAWVDSQREQFIAAANDPFAHTDVWAKADKPWQFLAFLFEYKDCIALQDDGGQADDFVSYLPIALDGSCNGLQNFSAALRDEIGGKATNLVPADIPADIYSEVARVCTDKLNRLADHATEGENARRWLDFCAKHGKGSIPRSMAKRPVMTLPYGATRQSCTKYIFESILSADREHFEGNFKAACWLTPLLWDAIGEVVIAARDAMGWLQKCSSAVSRDNQPLTWDTPDGFRVYQGSRKIEVQQIETQLAGRFRLNVGNFTDEMDSIKQRNAVAPNFVHSMDATHLRMVVRRAKAENITSLALVHDDMGTHACDTGKLHRCIREAFVSLYSLHDPLDDFRQAHEAEGRELPAMPPRGALDINGVLESRYFFG
jgi:DNA-directed RNA polymerase